MDSNYRPYTGLFKYELVSLMDMDGIKRAEKLRNEGWQIISSSPFSIQFEKAPAMLGEEIFTECKV